MNIPFLSSTKAKMCAPTSDCSEQNYGFAGYGFFVSCCTTDLCNSAPKLFEGITFVMATLFFALFSNYYYNQ